MLARARSPLLGGFVALVLACYTSVSPAAASPRFPYGVCTWWAAQERPDLVGAVWGDAFDWPREARRAGRPVTTQPTPGAIAVFQPGVQGAGALGHVAYVTAVGRNGWFQVSHTHWPLAGVVTYRWFQSGPGVRFLP